MPAPPVLRWSYSSSGTNVVDETLIVDEEGATWLWLFAGAMPERMDRAGTFMLPASADLAEEARELAGRLATTPQVVEPVARGAVPLALGAGGVTHQLDPRSNASRSPAIDQALALADSLRARVLEAPVSAIRAGLRAGAAPPDRPASAFFDVTSIGVEEALVAFEPTSFAAFGYAESGETFTWRAMNSASMGLLDAESLAFIGGMQGEARLAPGQRGVANFVDALAADPGSYTVTGSFEGRIAVVEGKADPAAALPMRKFRITTAPLRWEAR
jgi:hypothetical protein